MICAFLNTYFEIEILCIFLYLIFIRFYEIVTYQTLLLSMTVTSVICPIAGCDSLIKKKNHGL